MILAEDELAHRRRPRRDHGARRRAGAPARRWSRCCRSPTDVLELEITPNRPDCLGVYGVAREVHAATGAPLAPPPWSEDAGAAGRRVAGAHVRVEAPDLCPRFTARVFEDVTIGAVAAVAEGAPDGRRPAADQQRRRHHQLRDAADRPPAARVRPRPRRRRRADRAPGARRRADRDARRRQSARSTPTCWSSTTPRARRRSPASWAARARRSPTDTTRVLMEVASWIGPNIHRTSNEARPAQRGLGALREGPGARAGDGGPDRRHASSCSS